MTIRLTKHEADPRCGSHEMRSPDGRPSRISIGVMFRVDAPDTFLGRKIYEPSGSRAKTRWLEQSGTADQARHTRNKRKTGVLNPIPLAGRPTFAGGRPPQQGWRLQRFWRRSRLRKSAMFA